MARFVSTHNVSTGAAALVPFTPAEEAAADAANAAEQEAAAAFVPSIPSLYAMGHIKLTEDMSDVAEVSVSAKLAGAFMFDAGQFWVFLAEEQPDTSYLALAYNGGSVRAFVQDDEKFTDYFIIRTTNAADAPTNPASLNFEVKRVS